MANVHGLKGIAMQNTEVAGFQRKHGAPAFSKPHGPNKTILYYPDPELRDEAAEAEGFKDYAGTETPFAKTMVVQGNPQGSVIVSRVVRAGAAPNAVVFDGNPNREVFDAPIENEGALDAEVLEVEEKYVEDLTSNDPERRKELGLPALSLGDRVSKIDQEPADAPPTDALPVANPMVTQEFVEPDVPEGKRASGDTSSKSKSATKRTSSKTTSKRSKSKSTKKGKR